MKKRARRWPLSWASAVRFVRTDVTDEASVQTAVSTAVDTFGGLHGVVNCAGVAIAAKVLSSRGIHDLSAFSKVIEVNLIGTFNVIRLAAATMSQGEPDEAGERGVIVNTASVAAFDGQIGTGRLLRLQRGRGGADAAHCPRTGRPRHPRHDHCPRPL
jgi:NAD(P)-dependent dehydrogenase (short-subunit alcohol dehydrogenase family)